MKVQMMSTMVAALLLMSCTGEQTNSDGNGTGNADGAGGRQDPPTAPAPERSSPGQSDGVSNEPPQSVPSQQ